MAFVGKATEALVDVARSLRAARFDDPFPYRLLRTALWLPLSRAPAADEAGKTELAPLPAALRAELARAEESSAWHDLLRACEGALPAHPVALALQRATVTALAGLNLTAARLAVMVEVRALLARLPSLSALTFSDGSPLIDAVTREWLEANQLLEYDSPRPRPAPVRSAEPPPEAPLVLAQRALTKGAHREALTQAAAALKVATSDRERFEARLVQARACALANNPALATALFERLDRELVARGLETWDPPLAAEVLRGLLALPKSAGPHEASWETTQSRLFVIDPQAALELKSRG